MDDELHSATFIEETFGHNSTMRRQSAERGGSSFDVLRGLLSAASIEAAFFDQPPDWIRFLRDPPSDVRDLL
jgi:hypothetical protein